MWLLSGSVVRSFSAQPCRSYEPYEIYNAINSLAAAFGMDGLSVVVIPSIDQRSDVLL